MSYSYCWVIYLCTFMTTWHVTAFPYNYSGSIAVFSTVRWFWVHACSSSCLYAADCLCTHTPFAPFAPAAVDLYNQKKIKDKLIKTVSSYGRVTQRLRTTEFANLIGWNQYWPRSGVLHLDRHCRPIHFVVENFQTKIQKYWLFSSKILNGGSKK